MNNHFFSYYSCNSNTTARVWCISIYGLACQCQNHTFPSTFPSHLILAQTQSNIAHNSSCYLLSSLLLFFKEPCDIIVESAISSSLTTSLLREQYASQHWHCHSHCKRERRRLCGLDLWQQGRKDTSTSFFHFLTQQPPVVGCIPGREDFNDNKNLHE